VDILLTYDIAETDGAGAARLRRVAKVCEKYGERVQLSVFECRLSPARFARLVGEVRDVIDEDRDSVIVYRFPGDLGEGRLRIGRSRGRELGQPWVI